MREAHIEKETIRGEKIKLSLHYQSDHKITGFDELETVTKTIKEMYDEALGVLFQKDSEAVVKDMIGMRE